MHVDPGGVGALAKAGARLAPGRPAAWSKKLDSGATMDQVLVTKTLTYWQADPDLSGLREPSALNKLSAEERKEWLALWREVEVFLRRTARP